jgi:hypothetical protein
MKTITPLRMTIYTTIEEVMARFIVFILHHLGTDKRISE